MILVTDTCQTCFSKKKQHTVNCSLTKNCSHIKIYPGSDCESRFGLHDQTVTVGNRAWTQTAQKLQRHKLTVNIHSIPSSDTICLERMLKKNARIRLLTRLCLCSQKLTLITAKENITSRSVQRKHKIPNRAEHPLIKKPSRLASSVWSKHKNNPNNQANSQDCGNCNCDTCHRHMSTMFFEEETTHCEQ